jgi:hypothetical protein
MRRTTKRLVVEYFVIRTADADPPQASFAVPPIICPSGKARSLVEVYRTLGIRTKRGLGCLKHRPGQGTSGGGCQRLPSCRFDIQSPDLTQSHGGTRCAGLAGNRLNLRGGAPT